MNLATKSQRHKLWLLRRKVTKYFIVLRGFKNLVPSGLRGEIIGHKVAKTQIMATKMQSHKVLYRSSQF